MAKPFKKKPLKEVQVEAPKSVWLRAQSADPAERQAALEAIELMTAALESIAETLHLRTLPPPPPPVPVAPKPSRMDVFEIPFGVARRRWRRSEQVPRSTEEFAAFFRFRGITILEVTPGSINVPKEQTSRINRILSG